MAAMVTITAKVKKNILFIFGAVALATAFFMHETIAIEPAAVVDARAVWQDAKAKRTAALNNLKASTVGTELYNTYKLEADKTDAAFNDLEAAKADAEFLGFKTLQQFLGEFGWCFGLLLYSIINLLLTFKRRSAWYFGELFLHTALIFIALFFVRWCFNPAQDLAAAEYILANLLIAITTLIAAYYYQIYQNKLTAQLRAKVRILTNALVIGVKPYIKENLQAAHVKFYLKVLQKINHEQYTEKKA